MGKIIETKYDIGDVVWIQFGDAPKKAVVEYITIYKAPSECIIEYTLAGKLGLRRENKVYSTKEECEIVINKIATQPIV